MKGRRYGRVDWAFSPRSAEYHKARNEERQARKLERRARQRAKGGRGAMTTAVRAQRRAAGLTSAGARYTTYATWKTARTLATKRGDTDHVHILDTQYPPFANRYATEQTPLAQAGAREALAQRGRRRNALSLARKRSYRREDLLDGEYPITSYHQFAYHYRAAMRSHDVEVIRYLSRHYHLWLHKLTASDAAVTAARKEARREYQNKYEREKRAARGAKSYRTRFT